ncbi:Phthiocerol synthesis polyketide synthase type I PpsC [Streptomyces sp. S4.7]|uniref:NADP-dependent oxidoreductase n=1 Tax=Streptomyces sp. S4.7 TaxID=2705439 RepID=UPI0013980CC2|nr:NADP-dependent oxidoreductase [Streptomyces sp. S4.7]QHY98706.1 Phthiocerol synthesis polyketide synthase type I PpsC [Streptomyces sp. S4.7]
MPRAVRYDRYGAVDVLYVADVARPAPAADEVVVEVVAAGLNPGEIGVREGLAHAIWPATFPSGQGSDLAGEVVAVGSAVSTPTIGAQVIGFTNRRAAQADYVAVPADQVTPKPAAVGWDVAGSLFVAGTTAYAAVRAVGAEPGETVALSAAAGGVGSLAVQLLRRQGVRVLAVAGEANHEWLASLGAMPIGYGEGIEGVEEQLRAAAPEGVDAFIDTYGSGHVELAMRLGVAPVRINTIIDFPAAKKFGTKSDGNMAAARADVLAELAALVAEGAISVAVSATYPVEQVREAYAELARPHSRGKIVLRMR